MKKYIKDTILVFISLIIIVVAELGVLAFYLAPQMDWANKDSVQQIAEGIQVLEDEVVADDESLEIIDNYYAFRR